MTIVVTRTRRETPGCAHVLHLDNAGSALPPQPVLDAVIEHLHDEAEHGGYEAEHRAQAKIERTYDAVAELLHCQRDEVALCESATIAWDRAFAAVPLQRNDRVLIGRAEYASNALAILQRCHRVGAKMEVVPDDEHGQTSPDALRSLLDQHGGKVKLISLTHVPTNGGLVNPAAEIGAVARKHGVLYLLDACQSAGQMPLDVEAIGCDLLSFTGRKFLRGPRGTGALYVRRSVLDRLEPSSIDVRSATWIGPERYEMRNDARRFETWESSIAARIGLGVAIDYALRLGLDAIERRIVSLAGQLRTSLSEVEAVTLRDLGEQRCGIVTFTTDGWEAEEVRRAVAADRVNVSVTTRSSTLLDMTGRGLRAMTRASVHYYNTEDEIDRFAGLIARLGRARPPGRV